MLKSNLISIIIPTFNRAHLIGETLDSVLNQTYSNWECIVVDDGSSDTTEKLLSTYIEKDKRFKFFYRPNHYLPGGNGARNYGFEMSQGQYIQWFDSDDLMAPEKLEIKVKTILKYDVDFVISQTKYFNKEEKNPNLYHFEASDVNFLSYATTHINWFTPDLLVKRAIVEDVNFNEELKSGQEFNFFCKLLLITNNLKKINQVLTYRRYTENSIGVERRVNENSYLLTRFQAYWLNYKEISQIVKNEHFERFSLLTCISCYLRSEKKIPLPKHFYKYVVEVFGIQSIYFFLAKWSKYLTGKYNFFYKKLKN